MLDASEPLVCCVPGAALLISGFFGLVISSSWCLLVVYYESKMDPLGEKLGSEDKGREAEKEEYERRDTSSVLVLVHSYLPKAKYLPD